MTLTTLNIDGCHGARGTIIFAGAATETLTLVNGRLSVNHQDGLGGAMTGTGTAADAIVWQHHSMADGNGSLLLFINMLDSTGRTHLATTGTSGAAVALIKSHIRLHEGGEFGGRTQHFLGTLAYTKLAGGAAALKVFQRDSSCGL